MMAAVPVSPAASLDSGPSRREARKAETRQALIDAALQLFASEGYDETSVDEIVARAGVSPRTFFRYFPTKEEVLFFGEYDYIRSFTGVYLAQPPSIPEFAAIKASLLVLAPALSRIKERVVLYERAVASSPLLRGREQAHHVENQRVIAEALARRRGLAQPDDRCRMLAAVSTTLLRHSLDRWLASPAADPRPFIDADFESLHLYTSTDGVDPVASLLTGT